MNYYIKIPITQEMQKDIKDCNDKGEKGIDKDCETCSLNGGNLGYMAERTWHGE